MFFGGGIGKRRKKREVRATDTYQGGIGFLKCTSGLKETPPLFLHSATG